MEDTTAKTPVTVDRRTLPPGTAPIKAQYLLSTKPRATPDDDAAEGATTARSGARRGDGDNDVNAGQGLSKRALAREQKKSQRGANKARRFGKVRDEVDLCWRVANGAVCEYGAENCRFTHDVVTYLESKTPDLRIPQVSEISDAVPFVTSEISTIRKPGSKYPNVDYGTECPIFQESGECRYGYKCRFMGGHASEDAEGNITLTENQDKKAQAALTTHEMNFASAEVQKLLRSKKYPTPIAKAYLEEIKNTDENSTAKPKDPEVPSVEEPASHTNETANSAVPPIRLEENGADAMAVDEIVLKRTGDLTSQQDAPDVPARFSEKKRLDWAGKTYLAPLTTVGNLPFRRLCVKLGADITCGEMGLANSFLAGSKEEWSLVRRHPSESIFGIQVAGNKPHTLVPTAEIIGREFPNTVDFVDLNCGCPIDLVFRAGSGSALLDSAGKLGKIIVGMNKALGEIPLTVKLRTGVKEGRNNAHKLMPRVATEWQASALTLHGRTRQQRYTKSADWNYIKECVEAVRAKEAEEDLAPVPIFGGGDCYSAQDYWEKREKYGVDGIMIARGALIKPWIFTEVKEHREWDISARERLDLMRDYVEFGLNHFGTDTAGVNTTRRYLCEALSFQYRYVPIGLLETLPPKINERAPAFTGRNDLETLLASPDSSDWVKVSEMFLGPPPPGWIFTPKHKSNSYGGEESQG
ncbi:zinc finger dihydrouridine synthase [Coprinopsis marcescibilis]|uniref:tRNA-dihydrouridine(47) synthase [NAD(P)(+)] n=1 Tax=Coprinopsis marcescibilis TaxID=230819 RepID=A0A5C3L9R4_COPMA|nr:zinc finger dihydrouridine synthase [Coprinopsis marcescibilis]